MPLNRPWHEANRMPKRATFEERARWHLEHQKACACRPIPVHLANEMRERGLLGRGER